jgi:hypothetical protein
VLPAELDEDLDCRHERCNLGKGGALDHGRVEDDGVGVVGALEIGAETVKRVKGRLGQLK